MVIIYDLITYDLNTCPHMIWTYIVSAFFSLQIYDDHIWSLYMIWSHMIWTIVHIWFDYIWLPYMICGIWFATYDHIRDRHMIICRFWNMIPYMVDPSNHIRKSDGMTLTHWLRPVLPAFRHAFLVVASVLFSISACAANWEWVVAKFFACIICLGFC